MFLYLQSDFTVFMFLLCMDLVKIARRIAAMPRPVVLEYDSPYHVDRSDIKYSDLDEISKEALMKVLQKKYELQNLFRDFNLTQVTSRGVERAMERMSVGKAPVVMALFSLLQTARPIIESPGSPTVWDPKFDKAFSEILEWEFPFVETDGWHVDIWIQNVHELATSIFDRLQKQKEPPKEDSNTPPKISCRWASESFHF